MGLPKDQPNSKQTKKREEKDAKEKNSSESEQKSEDPIKTLDAGDLALLKTYGVGPYTTAIKNLEEEIKVVAKSVNDICGIKESDTGLAPPSQWDLVADKQAMQEEQPLQVARCTKILDADTDKPKYIINIKQIAKFVVGLGDKGCWYFFGMIV